MGEILIAVKVKNGVPETKHQLTQATPQEIALAISQLELLKLELLTYLKKMEKKEEK